MRLLLDTHCWLWMQTAPERFSSEVRAVLASPENALYLSAASAWEIAIKYALGKLPLPMPPAQYVPSRMKSGQVLALPLAHEHALRVADLPPHHSDPFDRVLVAQAQIEDLVVVTVDPKFEPYEVRVVWADKPLA